MIAVFGHKNPDTDSIGSSLLYAWYLTQTGQVAQAFRLGEANKETLYVLGLCGIDLPPLMGEIEPAQVVAIVDTNNPAELPELSQTQIHSIVDHHKLAGLVTSEPLSVTLRPLACTATILFAMVKERGLQLPPAMAKLMLSCVVSDTLNGTSPTTTDEDRRAMQDLALQTGLSLQEHADAMFAAKSNLAGMTERDILLSDSKLFTMGSKKVRVSSLETTDPSQALDKQDRLIAAMTALKVEDAADHFFFFVVDIVRSHATLLVCSETDAEIARQAFALELEDGRGELPGVVSRKKQIIPPLERVLV
jgi:manganese-dependent inorganic pyrophosphatase